MPVYEYECPAHGPFEDVRAMADYRRPQACPECGVASPRVLLTAAALGTVATGVRAAHAVNERSAHAPKTSAEVRHGKGCGCCGGGAKKSNTLTTPDGAKTFPSQRPWMISH
jgi:putative FmdB family regulatory protein